MHTYIHDRHTYRHTYRDAYTYTNIFTCIYTHAYATIIIWDPNGNNVYEQDGVQYVLCIIPPNMNPSRGECVSADDARELLDRCYNSIEHVCTQLLHEHAVGSTEDYPADTTEREDRKSVCKNVCMLM
jgi:hypothetical protein